MPVRVRPRAIFGSALMFTFQFLLGLNNHAQLRGLRIWTIVSVALGLSVLIVLSSIFNGFATDVKTEFYKKYPHFFVYGSEHSQKVDIGESTYVDVAEKIMQLPVLVSHNGLTQMIILSEKQTLPDHIIQLPYPLSADLAANQDAKLRLSLLNTNTLIPYPRHYSYQLDVDYKAQGLTGFVKTLRPIASRQQGVNGWKVWLKSSGDKVLFVNSMREKGIHVYDYEQYLNYALNILNVQKLAMVFVFSLLVLLLFTQMVAMFRQVLNSYTVHIAYCRTSGVPKRKIFFFLFKIINMLTLITSLLGLILGSILSYYATNLCYLLENALGMSIMASQAFILNYLPSQMNPFEVIMILVIFYIVAVTVVSSMIVKSIRLRPVDVYRRSLHA